MSNYYKVESYVILQVNVYFGDTNEMITYDLDATQTVDNLISMLEFQKRKIKWIEVNPQPCLIFPMKFHLVHFARKFLKIELRGDKLKFLQSLSRKHIESLRDDELYDWGKSIQDKYIEFLKKDSGYKPTKKRTVRKKR